MPHINRIRVNNVKYNFGTQAYDDFVMKPFCGNTLYDLANGGGKSVLMLLLMQTVIPNSTLDEKQPVEKLFRGAEGSKTIHSLVEWRLDDVDVKNGFRYMTAGFCARKAAQTEEESKDTASIEYFNYCIFYRDYNDNDIRNLPLVKDKERITYSGLRRYLKELERDNSLQVYVFDRKGEYQNFLAEYGIYESQWEIIRGINKTEGHVRTYFETNYKTTRKVVEDLLIEEILGTSFQRKAGREDLEDTMSRTLLDMKDKLVELAKQKDAIRSFDRQTEVLNEFSSRVSFLGSVYREKAEIETALNRIYNTAEGAIAGKDGEERDLLQKEAELETLQNRYEGELAAAGLCTDRELAKQYAEQAEALASEAEGLRTKAESLNEILVRRESGNDYLEYLEEKKKRDETAATLQAMSQKDGLRDDIAALVREFDRLKEIELERDNREYAESKKAEEAALCGRKTAEEAARDVERELSVNRVLFEQTKKEKAVLVSELNNKKSEAGILLNEDITRRMFEKKEQKSRLEEKRRKLRDEAAFCKDAYEAENAKYLRLNEELCAHLAASEQQNREKEALEKDRVRADKLAEAYREKDYRVLFETVRNRIFEARKELERLELSAEQARKRRQEIESGIYAGTSAAAERVKEYIITRYKKYAVIGAEYLRECGEEEQKELLKRFPGFLYAVITDGFAEAEEDALLSECIPEECVVPIIRLESMRGKKELFHREQLLLCAANVSKLYEEKERRKEIVRLTELEEESDRKKNRVNSLLSAYEDDEKFLLGFVTRYYDVMYSKKAEYGTGDANGDFLRESLASSKSRLSELELRREQIPQEEEECYGALAELEKDLANLKEASSLVSRISEKEKVLASQEEKRTRLEEWKKESETVLERTAAALEEAKTKTVSYREKIELLKRTSESYDAYRTEGEPAETGLALSELTTQIDGKIAALHTEESSLEDKRRLLDSYVLAMNRLLKNIRNRGVSIAQMTELAEGNGLIMTSEQELSDLSEEIKKMTAGASQLEKRLTEYREKQLRLEGKNSRAEAEIAEKYGEYHPIELTGEALTEYIAKHRELVADTKKEVSGVLERKTALHGEIASYTLIKSEIEHLFEGTSELTADCGCLETTQKLEEAYKEARERYSACTKEVNRRREEFYRNRQTTMETLQVLSASALAGEISGSVTMPRDLHETEEIVRGLKEVTECLALERTRIEAGIGDLESIRANFEEQCLQRCRNIKADLERLPKLSRIMLDGEAIPMISLQIPYVKEEFYGERMAQYIDGVIRETDTIKDTSERLRYIRGALSYKKLFSVIVTDMNAIRLLLYKRERVREQSRMLRYEEAVGSTGQSQGIYIQFLIAVINYIASIYSPKGEASGLRKVIFIDNPFGAAKDVYIWEPIFELMRANHVQLIVPARGTTPAITGRFDVNYVLGQKLIDGRQQTVVVDYQSHVETESIEFIPLQFEQTSLDISEV